MSESLSSGTSGRVRRARGGDGAKGPIDQVAPGLVRCLERVPADVPVGMHLCYGDYGHQHFKQPESLQMQVDLVNAVTSATQRPLNFVSFTVPQGRNDSAYFEPLGGLKTDSETELYSRSSPTTPMTRHRERPPSKSRTSTLLCSTPRGAPPLGYLHRMRMGRVDAPDVPRLLDLHSQILASSSG